VWLGSVTLTLYLSTEGDEHVQCCLPSNADALIEVAVSCFVTYLFSVGYDAGLNTPSDSQQPIQTCPGIQ
jgi:hypothetical protein